MYIFIIFLFNKDSDLEIYAVAVFVKNKEQDGQMAWRSKLKNYRIIFVFVEMRSLIFEHFARTILASSSISDLILQNSISAYRNVKFWNLVR